jgi:hypothetical protein
LSKLPNSKTRLNPEGFAIRDVQYRTYEFSKRQKKFQNGSFKPLAGTDTPKSNGTLD